MSAARRARCTAGRTPLPGRTVRLEVPCVGRVHPVVSRSQADDLLDQDALPVVKELRGPVQGDDGAKNLIRFELVQPC